MNRPLLLLLYCVAVSAAWPSFAQDQSGGESAGAAAAGGDAAEAGAGDQGQDGDAADDADAPEGAAAEREAAAGDVFVPSEETPAFEQVVFPVDI